MMRRKASNPLSPPGVAWRSILYYRGIARGTLHVVARVYILNVPSILMLVVIQEYKSFIYDFTSL